MRVAALSQQGKEGWLCKGGYLRKTLPELGTTPQGVGGASTTSGSKPGKTRRAERVSRSWAQNGNARPRVRSAPAPCVRARARSLRWPRALALAKASGRFEARAGGPPSLRLPEGPAPTHGRRRSPPRSPAPRCEVSPGACGSPVRLSGRRAWGVWGLRRCCRGCPLLCLTLCRGATSSPGSSSSGIVILVAAETKALGAGLWRGVSELLGVGGGPAGRGGAGFGAGG